MKSYKFVDGEFTSSYEIKRSEFIVTVKGVSDEDDAISFVAGIKKKYSDATHNCYAYIADENGLNMRFSDDGEPSGTAGLPILETLKKAGLKKTAVVVTRYFGGIKLGASGLVGAYTAATVECIEKSIVKEMESAVELKLTVTFSEWAALETSVKRFGAVDSTEYGDGVTVDVFVKPNNLDALTSEINSKTSGKAKIENLGEKYYGF
ncbi:MAG: IMPACT family protein [Christensenellales bacterium]